MHDLLVSHTDFLDYTDFFTCYVCTQIVQITQITFYCYLLSMSSCAPTRDPQVEYYVHTCDCWGYRIRYGMTELL